MSIGGGGTRVYGGVTGTDVSDTTAVAADVAAGAYFYTAAGVRTEGTAIAAATNYVVLSVPAVPALVINFAVTNV